MKTSHLLSLIFPCLPCVPWFNLAAHAGPRASTNYTVHADTADSGGQRTSSAAYASDGSFGFVSGISTVAAPAQTAKAGYIGQLYEVTGLTLTSTAPTVNETATLQLAAWQSLDDATFLAVPATSATWSVQSGPFSGIDASGLATAATVYQDTAAVAQAVFSGFTGTLNLTVLNSIADNFGTYAADGIDDDWQFQFFGLDNPNAAPTIDADFDGHDNRFEFTAGLDPTSAASRFLLSNAPAPNQPGQMNLVFSPLVAGRTYTVKASTTLGPSAVWTDLTSFSIVDNGTTRTITDLDATGSAKFYNVEIDRP